MFLKKFLYHDLWRQTQLQLLLKFIRKRYKKYVSTAENNYLDLRCCLTSPISDMINVLTICQKRVHLFTQWASKHLWEQLVSMQGSHRLSGHQVLSSNWHFKWNPRAVRIKGSLNWSSWKKGKGKKGKGKGANEIAGCLLTGSSVCLILFLLINTITIKHFQYWFSVVILH